LARSSHVWWRVQVRERGVVESHHHAHDTFSAAYLPDLRSPRTLPPLLAMKAIHRILSLLIVAACFAWVMCSCAEMPLTLAVEGRHGVYSYSSKGGLKASLKIRQEKSGPVVVHGMKTSAVSVHETPIGESQPITAEEVANRYRP